MDEELSQAIEHTIPANRARMPVEGPEGEREENTPSLPPE